MMRRAAFGILLLSALSAAMALGASPPSNATTAEKVAFFDVKVNGKYGFIDKTGKVVIAPQFAQARPFSEGLAAVSISGHWETKKSLVPRFEGGKWGYMDATGQMVIAPQFAMAYDFREGLAAVLPKEPASEEIVARYGYIDRTGRMVIAAKFTLACEFANGLAAVRTNNPLKDSYGENWWFIDKTGRVVTADPYRHLEPFQEGFALAMRSGKYYYLDPTGQVVLQAKKAGNTPLTGHDGWPSGGGRGPDEAFPFSEGLARIKVDAEEAIVRPSDGSPCLFTFTGGKWGFIDKTGKVAITPQFDDADDFSEDLAPVAIRTTTRTPNPAGGDIIQTVYRWGYIDKTGKVVIQPQFDWASPFREGLAAVSVHHNVGERDSSGRESAKYICKYGYIDKAGKVVIEPTFDSASSFQDGLACVGIKDDSNEYKTGYIDRTGKYVWPPTR
jgi:hypothetical protein